MEVGDDTWINGALKRYFEANEMFVGLDKSAEIGTRGHSIVRYAKTIATNSFLIRFKKKKFSTLFKKVLTSFQKSAQHFSKHFYTLIMYVSKVLGKC